MSICPFCQLHDFRPGDHFCGLCGEPLCQLVFENGRYVELPENAHGTIEQSVIVRNEGRSEATLRIVESTDPVVRLKGARTHTLYPAAEGTAVLFAIDATRLRSREPQTCAVSFESSDPKLKSGLIEFGVATPAKVVVPTKLVTIPELIASDSASGIRNVVAFEVQLTNTGGQTVRVSVPQGRNDRDSPVKIELTGSSPFILRGFCKHVPVAFLAWTHKAGKELEDNLVLDFHAGDKVYDNSADPITIKVARASAPARLEFAEIDFPELLPGGSESPGCGQTRVGTVKLRNAGGSACRIVNVRTESELVRVLPGQLPATIEPTPNMEHEIHVVLSTRVLRQRLPEDTGFPVSMWFETDCPQLSSVYVRGDARVVVPRVRRGLMAVDFGTVNSCVAHIDNGPAAKPRLVSDDRTGESFVPSMMLFVDGLRRYEDWLLHGPDIKDRKRRFARGIVDSVKRAIEEETWQVYDETYQGSQLATWIIEQLLLEASRRHNCYPEKVAMTIPAAFWGPKRNAMLTACERACNAAWGAAHAVPVTPIDEPTAVAMYFYSHQYELVQSRFERGDHLNVLVFDFGGGTLDISVVNLFRDQARRLTAQPLITRGDNHMGGVDLDLDLVRALAKRAKEQCPALDEETLTLSRWDFNRKFGRAGGIELLQGMRLLWYQAAKSLKERLSSERAVDFAFTPFYDGTGNVLTTEEGESFEFKCQFTQDMFEDLIRPRVERALRLVGSTLASIAFTPPNVDVVLLTGQSSQIPCFARAVREMFQHLPADLLNVSVPLKESVAAGAAWGAMERGCGRARLLNLDKSSYRYGIEGAWVKGLSQAFVELIPLGTVFEGHKGTVTLCLDDRKHEFRQLNIIQNGTDRDSVSANGTDPDVTAIGKVDLTQMRDAEIEFGLYFSTNTGRLSAEVNGSEVPIESIHDDNSEAVYL